MNTYMESSDHDGPRRKWVCGMLAGDLSSHLLLIGGKDEYGNDTDEIHMFDLKEAR